MPRACLEMRERGEQRAASSERRAASGEWPNKIIQKQIRDRKSRKWKATSPKGKAEIHF